MEESHLEFGDAAQCKSLSEATTYVRSAAGRPSAQRSGVALGMVIAAERQAESSAANPYHREDALNVLDALGRAKSELDAAALHAPDLAKLTTAILSAAQECAWEATVPCTEWPTPREIADV